MDKKLIILNPDYHLKNDIKRIVVYSKNKALHNSNINWISYIHPLQASILSFFSHGDSYDVCIDNLSRYLSLNKEKVEKIIAPYINNEKPFFTEYNNQKINFPKNVLIECTSQDEVLINKPISLEEIECSEVDLNPERFIKAPHFFTLMLNNKCVTDCKYCYADRNTKNTELSTSEILDIIEEASELRVNNINLIGGEVFLKKDWDIILKKLVEKGMSPEYLSTKVPINKSTAEKLYHTGYNNVIQISLDSINEDTLIEIIGVKKGYKQKLIDGIHLLQNYGFEIQINTILTSFNTSVSEMQSLYDFVKEIKKLAYWEIRVPKKSIYNNFVFEKIKPSSENLECVSNFITEELIPLSHITIIYSDELLKEKYNCEKCTSDTFGGMRCGALSQGCFVLPDGKITLCEELYWHPQFIIGDLRKSTLKDIWSSDKANYWFRFRKEQFEENSICGKCNYVEKCLSIRKRCWVSAIRMYGDNKWHYPDPHCEKAPKARAYY